MSSRGHRGSISYSAPNPNAPADFSQPLLFEVAWEVANKVGGIYTVIKTKVPFTVAEYAERYCLIGPYAHAKAQIEVEPIPNPPSRPLRESLDTMRAAGVHVVYGKWLVEGSPAVILFDLGSARKWLGDWKTDLWLAAQVPTPPEDWETDEAVIFGYLVQWFLGEYVHRLKSNPHPIASDMWLTPPAMHHNLPIDPENPHLTAQHSVYSVFNRTQQPLITAVFHEWLVGVGLILVAKKGIDVATVFVTHATLLGRYLCAGAEDFYNNVPFFDCDNEAGKRQIYQRYCIERGAAHSATVFATVSGITGYEAEYLLKRKPDGIVPNGLNVKKFQAMHEFQNLHARNKEKIHEFVRAHWYGHYDFDLDNTLYFFTAGRLEHRNKGLDLYIEALARLNARLRNMGSPITVVAFIVTSAPTRGFGVEALKGQAVMKQLKDTVDQISKDVAHRMIETAARRMMPDSNDLLTDEDLVLLKRRIFALKRDTMPPIVTHNMVDDSKDPILSQLRTCSLFNFPTDRVKVIYHPEFLNSNNPVLPMDYDDFVRGTHLGVFPSYYEPWGYTPAECTVMGVPSITSNLSGFGNYMEELVSHPSDYGIYIVDRRFKNPDESVEQLVSYMLEFCQKTRRQRINQRNRTERLSYLLDWKRMGIQYQKMRWLALRRKYPDAIPIENLESEEGMPVQREDREDDGLSVSGVDGTSESVFRPVEDDEGVDADLAEMATPKIPGLPDMDDETAEALQALGISEGSAVAQVEKTAHGRRASSGSVGKGDKVAPAMVSASAPVPVPAAAAPAPAPEVAVPVIPDRAVAELENDVVEDVKELKPELLAAMDEPVRPPSPLPAAKVAPASPAKAPVAAPAPAPAPAPIKVSTPAAAPSAPAKSNGTTASAASASAASKPAAKK